MDDREQKDILTKLKASKDNNVMLKSQDGKKYSFTVLDLIKYKDKRMYAVVKPPIDFPSAKPNSVMVFVVRYNKENFPCMLAVDDKATKINVYELYNERKRQSA